jgi:hypothetical protein
VVAFAVVVLAVGLVSAMILNFKFCNEKVDVDFLLGHNSTEKMD